MVLLDPSPQRETDRRVHAAQEEIIVWDYKGVVLQWQDGHRVRFSWQELRNLSMHKARLITTEQGGQAAFLPPSLSSGHEGEGADVILLPRQRKETSEAGLHEIQNCLQTIVLGVDLRETTTSSDQQNDEVIRNNAERAKRLILKLRDHWLAITADANIHT